MSPGEGLQMFPHLSTLRGVARLTFTARVQRGPSNFLHLPLGGVAEAALYCAHRTSTFLSCAFCEQEGHLAAPSHSV